MFSVKLLGSDEKLTSTTIKEFMAIIKFGFWFNDKT